MRKLALALALLFVANNAVAQESVVLNRDSRVHEIVAVLTASSDSFNKLILSEKGKEMIALCGIWGRGAPLDCVTEEGRAVFIAVIGRAVCATYRKELELGILGQPWKMLSDDDVKKNVEFVEECRMQSRETERFFAKK